MYCSFCGKEIPDGSTFCGYCGKKLVYLSDAGDGSSYDDGYGDDAYEGLEPVFVAPQWNTYPAADEWGEEELEEAAEAAEPAEPAEPDAAAEAGGEVAADEADGAGGAVGNSAAGETDESDGAAAPDGSTEAAEEAKDDGGEAPGQCGDRAAEGEAAAEAAEETPVEEAPAEETPAEEAVSTVRRVSKPISDKTYLKEVSANGVQVPSQVVLGETAPRKRMVPIGLVVVIAFATLLAGAGSAYSVAQYYFEQQEASLADAAAAPATDASDTSGSEPEGAAGAAGLPDDADAAPAAEADAAAEDGAEPAAEESQAGADAQPAASEEKKPKTGYASCKKLIAALQKPLEAALEDNLSDATMRLLVLDELDFMPPVFSEALVAEAGFSSPSAYSRKMVDEQARQLSAYASTWSFKLAQGKKCSARNKERIERQCQIMGVELPIEEAYKIEAVTATYPTDYNSKNVDDEGLYHQVTSYTAIQSNGRWYLYTDALVSAGKAKK